MPTAVPTLVFREWGKGNGFRRKGTTLYRDQEETVAVVNLQASRYGGRYYLNVALWLKAVGDDDPAPKENKCHLRTRLAELRPTPDDDERQEPFLDLNSGLSDDERRKQFRDVLDSCVTTALSNTGTVAELKARPDLLGRFLLNKDAHNLGLRGGLGSSSRG